MEEERALKETERHLMKPTRKEGRKGSNPNETSEQKSKGRKAVMQRGNGVKKRRQSTWV